MEPEPVDFRDKATKYTSTALTETVTETSSRLKREEEAHTFKLMAERVTQRFAIGVFGVLLLAGLAAAGWGDADLKKAAVPILTAMVGGAVGFLFGKKT